MVLSSDLGRIPSREPAFTKEQGVMCRTMWPPTIGNEKQSCNTFISALCAPHTERGRQPNPFFGNRFAHSYARRRRHHHHADKENGIGRKEGKGGKRRIGTKVEQIAAVKSDDAAPPVIPNSKWLAAIATMVMTNCAYSAQFAASFSLCLHIPRGNKLLYVLSLQVIILHD